MTRLATDIPWGLQTLDNDIGNHDTDISGDWFHTTLYT